MRNHKSTSMRLMLAALRCNRNQEQFDALVSRYFIPEDVVESIKEEVTALSRQEEILEFDGQIDELLLQREHRDKFDEKAAEMLGKWKQEYNRLCRI